MIKKPHFARLTKHTISHKPVQVQSLQSLVRHSPIIFANNRPVVVSA